MLSLWIGAGAPVQAAGDGSLVLVCYPGGGTVSARQAEPSMNKMLGVLEKLGGWKAGTFDHVFTAEVDECRELLAERKPQYALTSLGLFLEHRSEHGLVPLASPRIDGTAEEIYRVLTRKDGPDSLAALKGKTLGGSLLDEPAFLGRVVFAGALDPKEHFELQPGRRALRALRKLDRGRLDAVLVNSQQYGALDALPFAENFQVVFESKPLPLVGLAASTKRTTAAQRDKLTKALVGLCRHPDGKEICDLFGMQAFAPAAAEDYQRVVELWKKNK
jgi:hypothetical protein